MKPSDIAILSTVNNFELYNKSASLYPPEIARYVFDGRNGMFGIHSIFYMMQKFKNTNIKWMVLMDEDALFINPNLIYPLIEFMERNDFIIAGMRDGGMLPERSGSPYAMNPYFSIINFEKLKKIWNKKEVIKNHYILENEFDDDLCHLSYPFNKMSMSEPYYGFYFWLKRNNYKLLYLDVSLPFPDDQITNAVHDLEGNKILYHTWFSREYGDDRGRHTDRIDKVFAQFSQSDTIESKQPKIFKDSLFPVKNRIRKFKKNMKKRLRNLGLIKG
jgi:hypothetical protein